MSSPPADAAPRHLITTLYGLYARDPGSPAEQRNWLSVASLVRLMADLGVDAAAVRSSVSRLKKRDVLRPQRHDGRAGYALSPLTVEALREGDRRIWERPRATPADGWLVVVFSVPEAEREKRHALRSLLARLGFGTAAPGVWVAPATSYDETLRALDRRDLTSYTEFFRGDYLGAGDVGARMAQWWDLDAIAAEYHHFLDAYRGLGGGSRRPEPEPAYRSYVPMLTAWRRLPYLDPGLPLEHLPASWAGLAAGELFTELDALLRQPAASHARALLGDHREPAVPAT
jgi:phenylacetic acid degradation operon negative regulatory protein